MTTSLICTPLHPAPTSRETWTRPSRPLRWPERMGTLADSLAACLRTAWREWAPPRDTREGPVVMRAIVMCRGTAAAACRTCSTRTPSTTPTSRRFGMSVCCKSYLVVTSYCLLPLFVPLFAAGLGQAPVPAARQRRHGAGDGLRHPLRQGRRAQSGKHSQRILGPYLYNMLLPISYIFLCLLTYVVGHLLYRV